MIPEVLISAFFLLTLIWYYKYRNMQKYLHHFKGPTPFPFIGNALYFSSTDIILPNIIKLHKRYGSVVQVSIGPSFLLSIADVKFLEFVMSSTKLTEKSKYYRYLHKWLGFGLLTSTGEKWKARRKMLTPAYHFKILETFEDVFEIYSDILIEKLKKEIDKPSINIYPYVTLCSLDIICASSMGTKINAQEDFESEYIKSVKEMTRIAIERAINPLKMTDFLYRFTNDYKIELKALKILHDYTNNVIKSRKKEIELEQITRDNFYEDESEASKKKSLLDLLIQFQIEKHVLTTEDIREEVDTFMFEGHDTTSAAISFGLYCIANNAQVQKKIMEELREIFENDFTKLTTYKDLQEMKYLEKVIKETLRLYPSVPLFSRLVTEDTQFGNVILPKGITLLINTLALHRNPELYPNPDRFDPERFNLNEIVERSPYSFLPFSAGSRNCIGQKFAMLEMKAVISKVLKNYELLPSKLQTKLILAPETILKSLNGIHIRLKNRVNT